MHKCAQPLKVVSCMCHQKLAREPNMNENPVQLFCNFIFFLLGYSSLAICSFGALPLPLFSSMSSWAECGCSPALTWCQREDTGGNSNHIIRPPGHLMENPLILFISYFFPSTFPPSDLVFQSLFFFLSLPLFGFPVLFQLSWAVT